jgi:glucose/mannose-6-phosphate isomerase
VIDLDDAEARRAADPSDMLGAVARLASDARRGYETGLGTVGLPDVDDATGIAFCGMGGSAVSGDVVRAAFRDRLRLPVETVRGPELPEWVGRSTLVVCSSYSGNTAETLACFGEALERGSRVSVITSGGELGARATSNGLGVISVPPELVAPRAAVGHLTFGVAGALEAMGLLPRLGGDVREVEQVLEGLAPRLGPEAPTAANPAKQLARRIDDRVPIAWGGEGVGAVAAARWKTQFNENAKIPAFWSALPELDHNEVVGWSAGSGDRFFLVCLRTSLEPPDVSARFRLSRDIAESAGILAEEVAAAGRGALAQAFSLVLTGDYVSAYLGLLRGFDPTPVEAIDRLKRALAGA